jgi:acetate kinase
MNILALNPGSGSLGYKLLAMPRIGATADEEAVLKHGYVDHVQGDATIEAAEQVVAECLPLGVEAIGYRVVHGGSRFDGPARITPEVLESIRALCDFAPLHSPIDLAVIEAGSRRAPGVPGVAVFDTAFHRTLPEVASRYALPADIVGEGITELRRYGFHGIAHRYIAGRLLQCLGRDAPGTRLVLCHLGGGASVCAVRDGRSVDISMGLTPLEGLVMSTRSGDVDPGLIVHLIRRRGLTEEAIQELLYRKSGLLGLSGRSGDIRELEPAAAAGDPAAALALEVQAYRVRKYVGAYATILGGMDAIALSGALAENSAAFRARVLRGLEFLGVHLDEERNRATGPTMPTLISAAASAVPAWVIPADEERQIAREVIDLLGVTRGEDRLLIRSRAPDKGVAPAGKSPITTNPSLAGEEPCSLGTS